MEKKARDPTEIQWLSIVTHVDEDTGEILSKNQLREYIFIKNEKKVLYEQKKISWTKIYRKDKQLTLF